MASGLNGSAADFSDRWASADADEMLGSARASIDRRVELEVALATVV